ncbi:MAG: Lpg1974 family pore-forming outer membrane protein [Planctomycetota bacterium]|nr:Lpg1974 family pore-forming outer membrane protein [Planctomycetota bacterium]
MRTRWLLLASLSLAIFQTGPAVFGQKIMGTAASVHVGDVACTKPNGECADYSSDCGKCGCYNIRVFGDYLLLRARDAEVPYAVQANSNSGVPIQTSRIAILDPDFSSGVRLGFGVGLDECSELALSYTYYDVGTSDSITETPNVPRQPIQTMVGHPATASTNSGRVSADGHLQLNFQRADLDYRRYFLRNECTDVNYLIGACYGQLQQNFQSRLSNNLGDRNTNDATWDTAINFYGGGLRFGLEAEQYAPRVNMVFYAKGISSLLAGEFDASYLQQANGSNNVDTSWKAGRIVPTFDLEVGGGFYGPGGNFRATLGYVFSAWTNVVKTQDWVHGVQTNNFADMSGTMTFDGLVARIEGRF